VPSAYGSGSTYLIGGFQEWVQAGIFEALAEAMLQIYDELQGIDRNVAGGRRENAFCPAWRRADGAKPYRSREVWYQATPPDRRRWRAGAFGASLGSQSL
jgi:hypothetical protein